MALALICEQPETPVDWRAWSFAHMAHHRDVFRAIYQRDSVSLTLYLLDPIIEDNLGNWLYQHQTMHQQMDALLGIAGYDLLGLDWEDPDALAEWISLNGDEHYQAAAILGVA